MSHMTLCNSQKTCRTFLKKSFSNCRPLGGKKTKTLCKGIPLGDDIEHLPKKKKKTSAKINVVQSNFSTAKVMRAMQIWTLFFLGGGGAPPVKEIYFLRGVVLRRCRKRPSVKFGPQKQLVTREPTLLLCFCCMHVLLDMCKCLKEDEGT